jgi:hypothetical protein
MQPRHVGGGRLGIGCVAARQGRLPLAPPAIQLDSAWSSTTIGRPARWVGRRSVLARAYEGQPLPAHRKQGAYPHASPCRAA